MFSILRKARDQTKPGSLFSRSGGRGERDPGNEVESIMGDVKVANKINQIAKQRENLCDNHGLTSMGENASPFGFTPEGAN